MSYKYKIIIFKPISEIKYKKQKYHNDLKIRHIIYKIHHIDTIL